MPAQALPLVCKEKEPEQKPEEAMSVAWPYDATPQWFLHNQPNLQKLGLGPCAFFLRPANSSERLHSRRRYVVSDSFSVCVCVCVCHPMVAQRCAPPLARVLRTISCQGFDSIEHISPKQSFFPCRPGLRQTDGQAKTARRTCT